MNVSQILLVLVFLLSSANAWGSSDSSDSGSGSSDSSDNHDATTRRFTWGGSAEQDAQVDQAAEEVRNDWTDALATYDLYGALSELEMLQLYNEWKVEAKQIVANNPGKARFKLYKNLSPAIGFFNTFAKKNACHPSDMDYTIGRVWVLLEGVLSANEVGGEGTCSGSPVRGRRQLSTCRPCGVPCGGYSCCWKCPQRRRRLRDLQASEEIEIEVATPDTFEAIVNKLASDLILQCESIVHNVGAYAPDIAPECRDALSAAKCGVRVNVWDAISLVVDGQEKLAADMIEEKFLETAA